MRYLGSKRKLLSTIADVARSKGLRPGAHVFDIFSGTACVGRHFKEQGFRVTTNDRMFLSYVLQRALVVADRAPASLHEQLRALQEAAPVTGLISREYSPLGKRARGFFHEDQARAIDGAMQALWHIRPDDLSGRSADFFFLLLAALLEGASRVANIAGTYGAYLKTWQSNALSPLRLDLTPPIQAAAGPCRAYCVDANEVVRTVPCDLLYIDPPYNRREYAANYHVLEVIAIAALAGPGNVDALAARIYGKTGLLKYETSNYCRAKAVEEAFRALIADARAEHVIVSYSEEGLLSLDAIQAALAEGLGCAPSAVSLTRVEHKRFRSDAASREKGSAKGARSYKALPGRKKDGIHEWLFHACRPAIKPSKRSRSSTRSHSSGKSVPSRLAES